MAYGGGAGSGGGGPGATTTAPSPTYSLQAQGNEARLGQPIPVVYGRHIIFPDLAATPYHEYANDDQFLFQLHCLGHGLFDVEQIRIEDSPIESFDEVQYEVVKPGSDVTLFHPHVVTAPEVAGQEMLGAWIGPFAANPSESVTDSISVDIIMPRGLYYANNDGGLDAKSASWTVQARQINEDGDPVGNWITLGSESHSAATNSAIRKTYHYSVAPGRYEVQVQRTDAKDTNSRSGHELRWAGLRAYLTDPVDFGDVTLLAIKMRASDNLSQRSSRMINAIVTRKIPVWDPVIGWSAPQQTRSIAWAVVDVLKATYGAEMVDSRIDLAALHALDQVWDQRGDNFDAVFDTGTTVWEAIGKILRCGRAVAYLQTGILRVVRDQPQSLPVAMFGPRNIVKNSLKVEYLMPGEDTADAVTVEYFSPKSWKPDEVETALPDSQVERPAKVTLFGCTDAAQAEREGMYMAAANRYRRRIVTFKTEMEGLIPTYGDLIAITHDMPSWGQGGEVIGWDGAVLMLSEPLEWIEGQSHFITLRHRDGSPSGAYEVTPGDGENQAVPVDALELTPFVGTSEERTFYAFGVAEAWGEMARVISVRPRGGQVEIVAVLESDAVHVN